MALAAVRDLRELRAPATDDEGDFALAAVEDGAAQVMPSFLEVGLGLGLALTRFVIGQAQYVQRIEYATDF
ncbi:MAG: hypothetical protein WAW17_22705 [Rhodococcus sp. (in: high G+C Gram-positive bacteria)]|uniref:hypothetical protein n=1 Tax=Rhodococcus sp. TaxID=1831 RepID=UPI003BB20679